MRNKLVVALLAFLVALPLCGAGGRRRVERPAVLLVEGTITAVSATSISIRTPEGPSMTIAVTAATEIERGMADVAIASLQNGTYITARVEQAAGGVLTALEIHLHSAPPSSGDSETIRVAGTVTSVGAMTLHLKTERGLVTVNADTTSVVRRAGETIAFGAIKPGDDIVVAGKIVGEAKIFALAIEILLEPVPPPVPPVPSIYGHVSTVGASEMTVVVNPPDPRMGMPTRLVTVRVDAKTVIRKNGEAFRFAALREGDPVVVYGLFADDHTMLASRIDVLDPGPAGDVRGRVLEIGGDDIAIESDMPMPMAAPFASRLIVRVSSTTEIWRDGARVRRSDIHVGDFIEAAGDWIDATTLAAKKIAILPPPLVRVSGSVVSVGDHTLQLRESAPSSDSKTIEIRADAKTEIFAGGIAVAFDAIKAGDSLSAVGTRLADGAILAQQIDVSQPLWMKVFARVTAINGLDLSVEPAVGMMDSMPGIPSMIVRATASTFVKDHGAAATFASIAVGAYIYAVGQLAGDGVLAASTIEITDAPAPPLDVIEGTVAEVHEQEFIVVFPSFAYPSVTATVRVTTATSITKNGIAASLADLKAGNQAWADGKWIADGVFLAEKVAVRSDDALPPPPPPAIATVSGQISRIDGATLWIRGEAQPDLVVVVGADTKIVKNGLPSELSQLRVGDLAKAAGEWDDVRRLKAAVLEVMSPRM